MPFPVSLKGLLQEELVPRGSSGDHSAMCPMKLSVLAKPISLALDTHACTHTVTHRHTWTHSQTLSHAYTHTHLQLFKPSYHFRKELF